MDVAEQIKNINAECHPPTDIDAIIRRWIDQGQKVIASKHNWTWLRQQYFSFTTTASTEEYALSPLVDTSKLLIMYIESTPRYVINMAPKKFRRFEPGPTATGTPFLYRLVGFSPVQNQPSSASVLTLASSNSGDTTQTVRVQGLDSSDVLAQETVTLNGTSNVVTSTSFKKILSLSKSATTTGQVTITSNSAAVTNVVIPANQRFMQHPVVKLFNIPSSALTVYYDFTMKLPDLTANTDVSLIPEQYHDAIELYAKHRVYKHLNNPTMSQLTFAEFTSRINDMIADDQQPGEVWTMDSFTTSKLPEAQLPSNFPRQ